VTFRTLCGVGSDLPRRGESPDGVPATLAATGADAARSGRSGGHVRTVALALVALVAVRAQAAEPVTAAEASGYSRTSTYQEVADFVNAVAAGSELVAMSELATTAEGRTIPIVILSRERVRTPAELRATGKPAVMIMANIHAGEVEGKEASQMLIRDVADGRLASLLDRQTVLVIPIFNADGNDKLGHNRHDDGPELAGVRHNGQLLDLNRDYTKLETPEVNGLVRAWREWDPMLFVDMHTTNGSYHREPVTYATSSSPNAAKPLWDYMWTRLFPAAAAGMKKSSGYDSLPYGVFADGADPAKGWLNDAIEPRYGTNYFGLRNRLSILDENYSYADFKTRVLASYAFITAVLEYTGAHAAEIRDLERRVDEDARVSYAKQPFVVEWTVAPYGDVTVKSYEFAKQAVSAEERARRPWLGEFRLTPTDVFRDYTVPFLALAAPSRTIPLPAGGYVVLPGADEAVANLEAHGIAVERLLRGCHVTAESFAIEKLEPAKNLFQGHTRLAFTGHYETVEADLPAGAVFVDIHQPLARLVAELLEPEAADGLGTWGFFNRAVVREWSNALSPFPVLRVAARPAAPMSVPVAR
jgi:predicted deacylase